ncbi:MAG: tetratricopeptide repeat protein [Deltaproteobacteria bacterium]|nr:tetratricopeptide repeat protein [Deltaproteobacteria bacterium]
MPLNHFSIIILINEFSLAKLLIVVAGFIAALFPFSASAGNKAKIEALAAYARGNLDSALALFQQALKQDPDDAEIFYYVGQVLFESGRPKNALKSLEKALDLNPGFEEAIELKKRIVYLIEQGKGNLTRAVSPDHALSKDSALFTAQLDCRMGYDTKPLVEPKNAVIQISRASVVTLLKGDISITPLALGKNRVILNAGTYMAAYNGEVASELDYLSFHAGIGYSLERRVASGRLLFKAGYDGRIGLVRGGRKVRGLTLEKKQGFYLESHLVELGLFSLSGKRVSAAIWADYDIKRFKGLLWPYSYKGHDICVEKRFHFNGAKAGLAATGCMLWQLANDDKWSSITPRGKLEFRWNPIRTIGMDIGFGYGHDMHVWAKAPWTGDRLEGEAEFDVFMIKPWKLGISWLHAEYLTDERFQSYRRDLVLLHLTLDMGEF